MSRALLVGLVVIAVAIAALVLYFRKRDRDAVASWEARVAEAAESHARTERERSKKTALQALRARDRAFSWVLFEDFLYALYAEAHTARGGNGLARLAPYLSSDARQVLAKHDVDAVEAIIVGGMQIGSFERRTDDFTIDVTFTSNMTEKKGASSKAYFMEERWTFARAKSVTSRPPERARVIDCPNCGAPLDKIVAGKCGYCNVASSEGKHDWFVESVEILSREKRGPMLTGTTEEVGTDLDTVVASDAKSELAALRARDPAFTWPAFVKRVEHVFHAFHPAWSSQDLRGMRPYLSDNLFGLQEYWIKAYKTQGLRNVTENPRVVTVHLARVTRDKFYQSITVRVFASCTDYTLDAKGDVASGNRDEIREYSEYWTFIRGVSARVAPKADTNCPKCGAALADIGMAGHCAHCNAKVTSGEFDWVLSRIEQDEVYELAA